MTLKAYDLECDGCDPDTIWPSPSGDWVKAEDALKMYNELLKIYNILDRDKGLGLVFNEDRLKASIAEALEINTYEKMGIL